ncbi:uncharacterized protein LOC130367379 [Hyla sarda]|uniref:uncharacterized protein LOC130367379 n=1 Tax=Hyla sarda TaxID=327740 RepID=UPI0024C43888|nr:uncharacterized protein LOC130367379 [Hyla sarda]
MGGRSRAKRKKKQPAPTVPPLSGIARYFASQPSDRTDQPVVRPSDAIPQQQQFEAGRRSEQALHAASAASDPADSAAHTACRQRETGDNTQDSAPGFDNAPCAILEVSAAASLQHQCSATSRPPLLPSPAAPQRPAQTCAVQHPVTYWCGTALNLETPSPLTSTSLPECLSASVRPPMPGHQPAKKLGPAIQPISTNLYVTQIGMGSSQSTDDNPVGQSAIPASPAPDHSLMPQPEHQVLPAPEFHQGLQPESPTPNNTSPDTIASSMAAGPAAMNPQSAGPSPSLPSPATGQHVSREIQYTNPASMTPLLPTCQDSGNAQQSQDGDWRLVEKQHKSQGTLRTPPVRGAAASPQLPVLPEKVPGPPACDITDWANEMYSDGSNSDRDSQDSSVDSDAPEYWGKSPPAKKKLFKTPMKVRHNKRRSRDHSSSEDSHTPTEDAPHRSAPSRQQMPAITATLQSHVPPPTFPLTPEMALSTLQGHPELQALLTLIPTKADLATLATDLKLAWNRDLEPVKAEVSNLHKKVQRLEDFCSTTTTHLQKLQEATEKLTLQQIHTIDHLDDLDNRNRRNNLRIKGLPETVLPQNLPDTLQRLFNELLKKPPYSNIELDSAHRALRAKHPDPKKPRDVVCRVHHFLQKEAIQPLLTLLQNSKIVYRWGFPFSLIAKYGPNISTLKRPEDLPAFLEALSVCLSGKPCSYLPFLLHRKTVLIDLRETVHPRSPQVSRCSKDRNVKPELPI